MIALLVAALQATAPVAPETCADCHEAIVASYAASPMARALEPLRPGELAGLAPVVEAKTGLAYAFEGDGDRARIVESLARPGRDPHRFSAPLAFAIGAGVRDRSYAAVRNGRLWFAPLEAVGASGARGAALAPGHAMQPGLRFGAPITPECLACHTDALPPRDYPLNLDPRAGVASWKPRGISCAACHAGAAEHAGWRAASLAGETVEGADPIQDLAALPRVRRLSLCGACHLQGDARIELANVGLPPPGDDLLEHRAIFVADQATDEIGFVSQTERLVLSRCYLESGNFAGGGLACETCHDPHRPLADARERERTRAACARCHADVAGDGRPAHACSAPPETRHGDCVDCHMPERGVFDVASVTIHDHWIRRAPGPPPARAPLRFPESASGAWRRFLWPDGLPPSHVSDPGFQMMALYQGGHADRATALLGKSMGAAALRLPMFHHVRGALLEAAGKLADARAAYERAIELDPELGESVTNLGLLLGRLGEARRGVELLSAFLARHPRADGVLRNRAVLLQSVGDGAGAIADLERVQEIAPDAAVARALAGIHRQLGHAERAAALDAEARRLDPLTR